jgi:hypothetical protein
MTETVDTEASESKAPEAKEPDTAAPEAAAAEPVAPDTEAPDRDAPGPAEAETEEQEQPRSLMALLEQFGRELGVFARSAAELEAARNVPEIRRAVRQVAGLGIAAIGAATAFVFLNVAAIDGLSKVMAPWLAALVLAAAWVAIAGLLLFGYLHRARRWLVWLLFKAPPQSALDELERERNEAGQELRATAERIGPAVAIGIATAAIPEVGEVAGEVVGGVAISVVEAGDTVLEVSDEVVDAIAEEIPGGGVVAQVWDIVLIPGRFGVRVATTVLRRVRPSG